MLDESALRGPCVSLQTELQKEEVQEAGYHISDYIPGINVWVKKAYDEWQKGATVVCLLPARTDTRWFHEYIYSKVDIREDVRFLRGRLRFGGANNSAPFPSMVVVFY